MRNNIGKRKRSLFTRSREAMREYPRQFWVLVGATFIDRLGGALLFPFFTLYLTRKFTIGMTQVGVIFGVFAIPSFIGSMIGGALTDRIGRKSMLIFGPAMSAVSNGLMGVIDVLPLFIVVTLLVGILSETGSPAQQALIADLLPEKQRASGFGILRVAFNLAVTIGPVIGGFLASRSYLLLFISDAVTSLITAAIVYFALPETRQKPAADAPEQSMGETFRGYFKVLSDKAYIWFLFASILMVLVYLQMNTTLAVYLRDTHGVSEQGFGYILSLNAGMVVLFQFSVTRWINRYNPLMVMTAGTLLYAIGFAMYGFVGAFSLFLAAMAVITVGEMMVSPVGQAIVARLGPDEMGGGGLGVVERKITAEKAAHLLASVEEGVWTRLTPAAAEAEKRNVRIQVSALGSGLMKSDLRIPIGLVSTLRHTPGQVSAALAGYDQSELKDKIGVSVAGMKPQQLRDGDESVEITVE